MITNMQHAEIVNIQFPYSYFQLFPIDIRFSR